MKRRPVLRPVHRVAAGLAMFSALALVLTVGVHPTYASWVTTSKLQQSIGTASSTCTTPAVYRTTASSRFLSGTVAGVPLGATTAPALTAENTSQGATFSADSVSAGTDAATTAVSGSSMAAAMQNASGVTPYSSPAGSQTQYVAATSTGRSGAGSGSVTRTGTIDLTSGNGGGTLDVSSLLGQVSGGAAATGALSSIGLSIGRIASAATLDECALRWGAPLSSALSRSSSLSSLSVSARSTALHSLVTALGTQQDAVTGAFTTVLTSSAAGSARTEIGTAAANDLVSALKSLLGGLLALSVGSPTVDVTVTGDANGAAVSAQPSVTSGPVTVSGASETLTVDVAGLAGQPPLTNTAALTSSDGATISAASRTAVQQLVNKVGTGWTSAANGVGISVSVRVPIAHLGEVTSEIHGTSAQFAAGNETVTGPVLTLAQGAYLPGVNLSVVTDLVAGITATALTTSSQRATTDRLLNPLTSAIDDAGTALLAPLAAFNASVPDEASTLTSLFSVTLGEQSGTGSGPGGSYSITALHVRVLSGRGLDLAIASSSVGPDRTINQ